MSGGLQVLRKSILLILKFHSDLYMKQHEKFCNAHFWHSVFAPEINTKLYHSFLLCTKSVVVMIWWSLFLASHLIHEIYGPCSFWSISLPIYMWHIRTSILDNNLMCYYYGTTGYFSQILKPAAFRQSGLNWSITSITIRYFPIQ